MANLANSDVAPVRSMTGYASTRRETSAGELTLSLRSVNHRGLDLHFHLGGELVTFENAMRGLLKQELRRGHVEVRSSFGRDSEDTADYNQAILSRYVALFRQASVEFGLKCEPDLNTLLTLPGVLQSRSAVWKALDDSLGAEILAALTLCLNELNAFREREGRELCRSVQADLDAVEEGTKQMLAIRLQAQSHFVHRLQTRIRDILQDVNLSPSRLAEEAALLADRSDVQEELTRLTVHTQEVRRLLKAGGEVGKRLDFLLQEMNRETNTVLSKTSGIGEAGLTITSIGLAIKANIERMREQALNLE